MEILLEQLSQAAPRDHKTSPMLGKAKAVGTLEFVRREKRLQALRSGLAFETGMPDVDCIRRKGESRIGKSAHQADSGLDVDGRRCLIADFWPDL